jgi:tetratricopeptide (TPR) repeat protein
LVLSVQGQYEKAVELTKKNMRLVPDDPAPYSNLAGYYLALQHFDEARNIIHEAQARKLDEFPIHNDLYALAFLASDSPAMAEQQQWFEGQPEAENFGLALSADTEAYHGRMGKARELTQRAVDSAVRADNKEAGAVYFANAAVQHAAYEKFAEAKDSAAQALKLASASQGSRAKPR